MGYGNLYKKQIQETLLKINMAMARKKWNVKEVYVSFDSLISLQ